MRKGKELKEVKCNQNLNKKEKCQLREKQKTVHEPEVQITLLEYE